MFRNHLVNKSGIALIEPVVGAMLLAVILLAAGRGMQTYAYFQRHRSYEGSIYRLQEKVRDHLSCQNTLNNPQVIQQCQNPNGNYIQGISHTGTQLIKNWTPAVEPSSLRLRCRPYSGQNNFVELVPEFSLGRNELATPASFAMDPFSKKKYSWGKLFSVPYLCPVASASNPPPTQNCVPGLASAVLDFEQFNDGQLVNANMNNTLKSKYGISFTAGLAGPLKIARIVSQGEADPLFKAWDSIYCPGLPNHNRICNGGGIVGKRAMSSADALSTNAVSFQVEYVSTVTQLSFDILDLDGQEDWQVDTYTVNGQKLATTVSSKAGYGANTGNNAVTHFSISTGNIPINKVQMRGSKKISIFGYAFDNFKTGLVPCP